MNTFHKAFIGFGGCLLAISSFTSCSNDDAPELPKLPDEKVYSGKELTLNFSSAPMPGKSARLETSDNSEATLQLYSMISPKELSSELANIPDFNGPGILPAAPVVSLPITLSAGNGSYTFSGKSKNELFTFSYSGEIKENEIALDISDVKLMNNVISGTSWQPAPLTSSGGFTYSSSPLLIEWKSEIPLIIGEVTLDPGMILNALSTLPLIPVYNNTAKTSVAELFSLLVKSIGFRPDGIVFVNYVSTSNGADYLTSLPQNTIQYAPVSDNTLILTANPLEIYGLYMTAQSRSSLTDTISSTLMSSLMPELLKALANGIPMQFDMAGNGMQIYLGDELINTLMTKAILPLLSDKAVKEQIAELLAGNEALKPYQEMIIPALELLPQIIEKTTTLRIGLNLTKYGAS